MKFWILTVLLFAISAGASAADLVATPTSLAFGNVNKGVAKSLTFSLKNTTGHKMRAELTADAPFTVSPANPTLNEGQQFTITVSLPASAATGTYSGKKVTIKASRLGLIPKDQGTVSLSASVVILPDISIRASFNGDDVNQTVRTIGVHLLCTSAQGTTTNNTKVFISTDGGPEQQDMNITFVYVAPPGQTNGYGKQLPASVQNVRFRAVAAPPPSDSNPSNNESILKLTCNATECVVVP